jgi:4-hydroxy-3-methylbut-2-enyl diphosphate reductase IspH
MEAIKAIAKRTKTGKYKIDLPITNDADEVEVMVIVQEKKSKSKKTLADFAGKMKSNIDWVAYQKEIRNEWK